MLAGGAIVQGWGLGSTNLGPTATGKAATLLCFAAVLLVGLLFRIREEEEPSQA
jgi:hypothetical protein